MDVPPSQQIIAIESALQCPFILGRLRVPQNELLVLHRPDTKEGRIRLSPTAFDPDNIVDLTVQLEAARPLVGFLAGVGVDVDRKRHDEDFKVPFWTKR
jgi:hypothetical protein